VQLVSGGQRACIRPVQLARKYAAHARSTSWNSNCLQLQVGTPERPLSDLGLVSYRGYWTRQLLPLLMVREGSVSIKELSEATRIRPDDIITTLTHLNLIQYQKVHAGGGEEGDES
jgi:histone acetyltransferase MYST1